MRVWLTVNASERESSVVVLQSRMSCSKQML